MMMISSIMILLVSWWLLVSWEMSIQCPSEPVADHWLEILELQQNPDCNRLLHTLLHIHGLSRFLYFVSSYNQCPCLYGCSHDTQCGLREKKKQKQKQCKCTSIEKANSRLEVWSSKVQINFIGMHAHSRAYTHIPA